ncbi:MAG: hypothetical protein WDO24_02800 [Pseudomonadota bacterium]
MLDKPPAGARSRVTPRWPSQTGGARRGRRAGRRPLRPGIRGAPGAGIPAARMALPYYGSSRVDLAIEHGDQVDGHYSGWLAARHADPDALRGPVTCAARVRHHRAAGLAHAHSRGALTRPAMSPRRRSRD